MRKFVLKVFAISLPIFIIAIAMEMLLRDIPNDYSFKSDYLETNAKKLDVIFFGSSHTYYGINPEYISGNSFNASHISQSIDYDFAIFDKYKDQYFNLKTIVIQIDYPTLYSRISTGSENWRAKNYEIYYGINTSYKPKYHFELLSFKFSTNFVRVISFVKNTNKSSITCNKLGYGNIDKKQKDLFRTGISAAKRHTKSDKSYYTKNVAIVKSFVKYANTNNLKILFFTSPAFHTYTENLDERQLELTIKTIKEITNQNENCSYYNFLEDSDFNSIDFRDADHLNQSGAHKLSNKLNLILNN